MQFYMQAIELQHITIDRIKLPDLVDKKLEIDVLRLDKIHPLVSGNKWFKLHPYLRAAKEENKETILTYGGAWSNHILAVAAACKMHDLQSIGIIRGEAITPFSPTLVEAQEMGMRLFFSDREEYRNKIIPAGIQLDDCFVVPEGGYGEPGAQGAATIAEHFKKDHYTHICCAAGTGTMSAGLLRSAGNASILSISVLKNHTGLERNIRELAGTETGKLEIVQDHHHGGYAKYSSSLIEFMNRLYELTGIPTDFVYTAKVFFAVNKLGTTNYFPAGSRILVIHSGGLQGNASIIGKLIF